MTKTKATTIFLYALFLIATLLFPHSASSVIRSENGIISRVADGDTVLVVTQEQTKLKVRLYGIDCPEVERINMKTVQISKPGQPYGKEARNALANKVLNKEVRLDIIGIDKYRRMVGIIWIGKRNINIEMVREGYGEAYREYLHSPFKTSFLKAEKEAKEQRTGIWSLTNYERPSEFRTRMRIKGS